MHLSAKKEHFDLLCRWVRYSSKFNLSDILHNNNIHKIAIYGGGLLGVALYENLCQSIEIKYIIDRNPDLSFPYDVQTVTPPLRSHESAFLQSLDAVIITVDSNNIKENLSKYVNCISLYDLIINIDEYSLLEKTTLHIAESKATLLIADVTTPVHHIKNPSFHEKTLKYGGGLSWEQFYDKEALLLDYYDDLDYCSPEYCKEVFTAKPPIGIIKKGDVTYLSDVNLKYFNVVNNCRLTTDVPDEYDNTIHFFGICVAVGVFAEDQYTIESFVQRKLNETPIGDRTFRVVNRSNWRGYRDSLLQILETPFQEGDIIVLVSDEAINKFELYHAEDETITYASLISAFDRPHEYGNKEIFFDTIHMNHRGYKLLANKIYDVLKELPNRAKTIDNTNKSVKPAKIIEEKRPVPMPTNSTCKKLNYEEINEYLDFLQNERVACDGIIGSVVMNCNPFTLGHRFLVEEALKNCDFLYIFIVEEDKSFFPFNERMKCAKEGVADIKNVKVLPSGKFIISSLTFPEYFIKEQLKTTIDASLDIELFAKHIAPILNIKKRFVGQEPFCQLTRQYNRAMSEILPRYGIEFIVFKRKEIDSVPISASKVRELLDNEKIEELRMLLPETTFRYLANFKI